jgi:Z1 domain.
MSQLEELENIIKTSIRTNYPEKIPSEEDVYEIASKYKIVFQDITEEDFQNVIKSIHSSMGIRVEEGISVTDDSTYNPWIKNRKAEIDLYYWGRYAEYLQHDIQWNNILISTLDKNTDEIMDFIGDPKKETPWQRRGLILGDVQSGKTANYTAICNKAADHGFKVIILLTGTIENLRKQTQERLDAGFIGRSSQDALGKNVVTKIKGVGYYSKEEKRYPISFTSVNGDFNKRVLTNLNLSISSTSETVLFVIKKNKSVLENLYGWLKAFNTDNTGKIEAPLLLLDDEADNASINTKSDEEITAINKSIRNLLKLFSKAAYVGITATPFANIFIDPKSDNEMVGEDLFPRDFIYLLNPPSNYIGPNQIFGDSEIALDSIEIIDEDEMGNTFREKTKSLEIIEDLPDSLKEAMIYFVITNIIRNHRGQEEKHKTMLINVSHYTNVQNQLSELVNDWLVNTQTDVRLYSKLQSDEALRCDTISNFRKIFEKYHLGRYTEWETVLDNLEQEIWTYDIKTINQKSQSRLDYGNYKTGANIIAIGGNSLSRGLTLEGLSVSYFYRSSKMYDTLMQMARWFGYRDGYEDLMRIWMTEDMKDWYTFVTEASNELKEEVVLMNRENLTPKHFGLQVRAHPDSLLVTARNKMRSAEMIERSIAVEGKVIETSYFSENMVEISANQRSIEQFMTEIKRYKSSDEKLLWKDVPKEQIIELLNKYTSHPLDIRFNKEGLAEYIKRSLKLKYWDVSIPTGEKKQIETAGIKHSPLVRKSDVYKNNTIRVGKSRSRVRDRHFTKAGLDDEIIKKISEDFENENPGKKASGELFLIPERKPLLMLYFINPVVDVTPYETVYYGMGLAFPRSNEPYGKSIMNEYEKVRYVLNRVKLEEEGFLEYEEDEEDEDI